MITTHPVVPCDHAAGDDQPETLNPKPLNLRTLNPERREEIKSKTTLNPKPYSADRGAPASSAPVRKLWRSLGLSSRKLQVGTLGFIGLL